MKVVIVGGVAGGASAAARIRRLDEHAQIIMIERSGYVSYANCGLPYYVGGVIKEQEELTLQTPESFWDRFRIDVRVRQEVTAINPAEKTVTVRALDSGKIYTETYDKLLLAPGAKPTVPALSGVSSERVFTLRTVEDTLRIRHFVEEQKPKTAVLAGGGFIGLEMAENLVEMGVSVTIVQRPKQLLAPLDADMASFVHAEMRRHGVALRLGETVTGFRQDGDSVLTLLEEREPLHSDMVLLAIGVTPDTHLAKEAGLKLGIRGSVAVNERMETSVPDIYAVGDAVEVTHFVTGQKALISLAGPANKQGRIAADNICGGNSRFTGSQGSSVLKLFGLTAASTGINEKAAQAAGIAYDRVELFPTSHATYYPGAQSMAMKVLYEKGSLRLLGAHIVGGDGVDKRIDVLATAIRAKMTALELTELDLSYAPPYSSAKDPVNMAGFVAENILRGLGRQADWNEPETDPEAVLLDVREEAEVQAYAIPRAKNIPLSQLRDRLSELDKSRKTIVFCAIGVRAWNAARILSNNGFEHVKVYPGGARFYRDTHETAEQDPTPKAAEPAQSDAQASSPRKTVQLNCSGLQCPGPILEVFQQIQKLNDGEQLEVTASDPGFAKDIASWCRRTGNTLVSNETVRGSYVAVVQKGSAAPVPKQSAQPACHPQGKTIIVFDGDMDKVMASFIIANGALAMGRPVTMFFTFWGLAALRKPQKQQVSKSPMEKMFGALLPRGMNKLGLSKMNMGGMGAAMMKKIMKDKNVDSVETLVKKAMENGVRIIACSMSMDVMGIKPEELIDGVEIGGVGTYLGDAEESNVNLFI